MIEFHEKIIFEQAKQYDCGEKKCPVDEHYKFIGSGDAGKFFEKLRGVKSEIENLSTSDYKMWQKNLVDGSVVQQFGFQMAFFRPENKKINRFLQNNKKKEEVEEGGEEEQKSEKNRGVIM